MTQTSAEPRQRSLDYDHSRQDRLLHLEDDDVTSGLASLFTHEGIDTVLNAKVKHISGRSGTLVTVAVSQGGREKTLVGTHLLVAAGRRPNTENIGLELAGVELNDRGYVKVNGRLETTAPGVWAILEVTGTPQVTHVSVDDFRVIRDNLAGGNHVTTWRLIPYTLFTDPELARIGLTEKEAKGQNISDSARLGPILNPLVGWRNEFRVLACVCALGAVFVFKNVCSVIGVNRRPGSFRRVIREYIIVLNTPRGGRTITFIFCNGAFTVGSSPGSVFC